jgi:hypothetical protein
MVRKYPAKKKLFFAFLLVIWVPDHFGCIDEHEVVGIKARGGLEWIRHTKIGRIAYSKVHPDQNISDT